MIAEAILGNGDRAFEYYNQINPAKRNETVEEYECEPYVYPQNILGDEHPQFGLARNSWLSGTASWVYQAATQFIVGIKARYNGLQIDPCIPSKWTGFSVERVFRGVRYKISVSNPEKVSKGIRFINVNGKRIDGNTVPIFKSGESVEVEVVMG